MSIKKFLTYFFFAFICLSFVFVFSWSTSPFYEGRWEGMDSTVFKIIGRYWAEGLIPYVDIWDQKGPLIHAINAFGYMLTGNYNGIIFIQFTSLFITSIFVFKSLQLTFRYNLSLLLTSFIILSLSINYDGGNLVEEYLLPFISLSYYILLKYTLSGLKSTKHILIFSFLVGLSLAFSLFTRLTNALGLCASELIVCTWTLFDKRYRLFVGIVCFTIIGFMVISTPILLFFFHNDALSEMWYGTFTYNVEYAASMSNVPKSAGFFITSFNCFVLLFSSLILLVKKHFREGIMWLASAILPMVWFLNGANFPHYGMIVFQYLTISYVLISHYTNEYHNSYQFKSRVLIIIGFMVTICICIRIYKFKDVITCCNDLNKESYVNIICHKYHINKESLLLYNYSGKECYEEEIKPAMRFFYLHDFLISNGPSIEKKMLNSLAGSNIEWIIAKGGIKHTDIRNYVDNHYIKIDDENGIIVYELK